MKILELKCQPVGPLVKPISFLCGDKNCTIVYDENEAGKTSLVDIIVNMLFMKGSAQSRFQSRRFDDYDGYVKLEYQGQEITFTGNTDLDKNLGFPQEFSRLPIVRGSDLHFLWSGNREKKGPLIDACIQHFSADFEENLSSVVTNVRSAAGLPAKRNYWTKGKEDELRKDLDLVSKKELLLAAMANKEKTRLELQEVEEQLKKVRAELVALTQEQKELKGERQAALCHSAKQLQGKLLALRAEYGEGAYERSSREDLQRWTESATMEGTLREKRLSLKNQTRTKEKELFTLKQRCEDLNRSLKEAEEIHEQVKRKLNQLEQEREKEERVHLDSMAKVKALVDSSRLAASQRGKLKWSMAVGALLLLMATIFFIGKLLPLTGVFLLAGLGLTGWGLSASAVYGKTIKSGKEEIRQLIRELGLQPVGTAEEMAAALERYFQQQKDLTGELLARMEKECQEAEGCLQGFVEEKIRTDGEREKLSESIKELYSSSIGVAEDLDDVNSVLDDLIRKTGKPDHSSLGKALQEKEAMEREMERLETRLGALLGDEKEWREELISLESYLEQYPEPRPLRQLEQQKLQLEKDLRELKADEENLQELYERLGRQELEESKTLYAADCGELGTLALGLESSEELIREAIRNSLAAIWVQQVVETAKVGVEDVILEPLSRAGEIFHRITGRYDSIGYQREGDDLKFSVTQEDAVYGEELLSDGAGAQLLISLRLALLEQVLGDEPGLLVLDDPLLNSSKSRKRKAIRVLLDYVKKGWQLFYLTVDSVAVEIFKELGEQQVEVKQVSDFYED